MRFEVTNVLELVRRIQHIKGKYVKQTLTSLEEQGQLTPQARKIVLDNFNNFARALFRMFGYTLED